jgi:hypothetical protein
MAAVESTLPISPYRGVFACDAEKFSTNSDAWLPDFGPEIEEIIARTMEQAGLGSIWSERLFRDAAGDGYAFGFSPEYLPQVIAPALPILQELIFRRNRTTSRYSPLIRMRVAIHVGPIHDHNDPRRDGSGTTRVELHRLLDSDPLRAGLSLSDPKVTSVAAIVSTRAFDDAIRSERSAAHPSEFVDVEVKVKNFSQRAYIYIPRPSGALIDGQALMAETSRTQSSADSKSTKSDPSAAELQSGRRNMTVYGQANKNVAGNAVYHAGPATP